MANLDKQTPHFYMYQIRTPRVHNPTYNSTQVDHSCFSLYKGGPTDHFILDKSPSRPELREEFKRSRGNSQLSQFGSSILQLKDTDIYNNQKSQLDIINMQPVWHNQTIKKYPKYTLQDKDAYYYRRMAPKQSHPTTQRASGNRYQPPIPKSLPKMNGVQTYKNDKDKVQLDLWQSYQGQKVATAKFRANMLNHADDFRSLI